MMAQWDRFNLKFDDIVFGEEINYYTNPAEHTSVRVYPNGQVDYGLTSRLEVGDVYISAYSYANGPVPDILEGYKEGTIARRLHFLVTDPLPEEGGEIGVRASTEYYHWHELLMCRSQGDYHSIVEAEEGTFPVNGIASEEVGGVVQDFWYKLIPPHKMQSIIRMNVGGAVVKYKTFIKKNGECIPVQLRIKDKRGQLGLL